jgi:electron transfer flavoprotein beta subunit
MQARQKPLDVIPPSGFVEKSSISKFEKPTPKGAVKLIDADNIDLLIDLLHKEAKVI